MKIHVLHDSVINKIAAGEVIERPASVVRELVDNAIDAGATDITVYIENGGRSSIRVCDNGCGMVRDDALLSLERHATSKIRDPEDLNSIATYGFRGEALSSIAAVSQLTLTTRGVSEASGCEIQVAGGKILSVTDVAATQGTDIQVRRLFFNTPARRKFLRQPATERARLKSWLQSALLVHPEVRLRLVENDAELLNLARRSSFLQRAGEMIKGATVPVESKSDGIGVTGIIAHPSLARADSSSLIIFINQRLVNDRLITRAVKEGFLSTLKDREFPVGSLSITLDPALLDVNVHPQKSEVRFQKPGEIYQAVRESVASAVRSFTRPVQGQWSTTSDMRLDPGSVKNDAQSETPAAPVAATSIFMRKQTPGAVGFSFNSQVMEAAPDNKAALESQSPYENYPDIQEDFSFSSLNYVGQALSCYLFFEAAESVYVVDMHAAHERVTYNRIRDRISSRPLDAQLLLVPVTISLTAEESERCLSYQELFLRYGFEIEAFGNDTILIRSIPGMLEKSDIAALFKEVAVMPLEEMARDRIEEELNHRVARLACHASVRSGQRLTEGEACALIEQMEEAEFAGACPHGRPAVVKFKKSEIEKWFGRDR